MLSFHAQKFGEFDQLMILILGEREERNTNLPFSNVQSKGNSTQKKMLVFFRTDNVQDYLGPSGISVNKCSLYREGVAFKVQ